MFSFNYVAVNSIGRYGMSVPCVGAPFENTFPTLHQEDAPYLCLQTLMLSRRGGECLAFTYLNTNPLGGTVCVLCVLAAFARYGTRSKLSIKKVPLSSLSPPHAKPKRR